MQYRTAERFYSGGQQPGGMQRSSEFGSAAERRTTACRQRQKKTRGGAKDKAGTEEADTRGRKGVGALAVGHLRRITPASSHLSRPAVTSRRLAPRHYKREDGYKDANHMDRHDEHSARPGDEHAYMDKGKTRSVCTDPVTPDRRIWRSRA